MTRLLTLATLFAALPSYADTISCRADYDGSSAYETMATTQYGEIAGEVSLRYVTEDGYDLRQALSPREQYFSMERIHFNAVSDAAEAMVDVTRDSPAQPYRGTLGLHFKADGAEGMSLPAVCTRVQQD